ncbi:MAG: acyl-CoA dehydrogenase family protein, partial [Nocardiopsaceae bacterium]|nr:acyl-CoA dehydrogenase family protein [Nocardiopsaceae bacterium]
MALGLTPEHLELAAAVSGWAQRHCPADIVRAAVDADDGGAQHYRATLAPSLAGQGLFGLHLPEDSGGQGFGLPELAVALEETGRALLPGAYLATVLASAVLAEALGTSDNAIGSPPGKLLAKLTDGSLSGTVALGADLTAQPAPDDGLTVSGESGP